MRVVNELGTSDRRHVRFLASTLVKAGAKIISINRPPGFKSNDPIDLVWHIWFEHEQAHSSEWCAKIHAQADREHQEESGDAEGPSAG